MLYKEFVAETAQRIMAEAINDHIADKEPLTAAELKDYARDCIAAAKVLADALEEDYKNEPVDGGVKRYAEKETFFDNYVNWSKTA
jgi:hypothetical protein